MKKHVKRYLAWRKTRKFKFFIWHPILTKILKFFLYFILTCLTLYVLLGIVLFLNTDRFLYHPTNEDFYDCNGFKEFTREEFNGTRFYYRDALDDSTVLVYYHGNGGTACDRSYLSGGFKRIGVRQIFVEYSGYANDNVSPSKELLLQDTKNIQAFIDQRKIDNVAVVGESLGTAMASYHSSISDKVYSVILVAPFDSIESVANHRYLKYYPKNLYTYDNYDNIDYLKNYDKRLIFIHGGLDENIPIYHAKRLYNNTNTEEKLFIEFPSSKHNDLYTNFDTYRAIRAGVENNSLEDFRLIYPNN